MISPPFDDYLASSQKYDDPQNQPYCCPKCGYEYFEPPEDGNEEQLCEDCEFDRREAQEEED